jgi:hypothetical protein
MVNNFFRYTAVFLICTMHEELRMRYFALFVVILSLRQINRKYFLKVASGNPVYK